MTHRADNRGLPGRLEWVSEKLATEQIWGSGALTGKWEFIGSSVGLVPTNALGSRNAIGRISHGQST